MFQALRDVSFEIAQGEVVGVIGRNGAGKSTLLKVLGRITEPTAGSVKLRGRVSSLLEVGTGFHPELTGRENIFLNGSILGMRRAEVRRKFDEIVSFAEIARFLDVPVKRYSSGMQVRLAFAVAAHLEPEILLVDEVLAVGDVEFQKRCLDRMHEVSRSGRTILFVSHNMAAISTLTSRVLHFAGGRVLSDGPTAAGIREYLRQGGESATYRATLAGTAPHSIISVEIPSLADSRTHISGTPLTIRIAVRSLVREIRGCLSLQVVNESLQPVLHLRAYDAGVHFGSAPGETVLECTVDDCRLNVGRYVLNVDLSGPPGSEHFEHLEAVCPFDVEVHERMALFGWRPNVCCYIPLERWAQV